MKHAETALGHIDQALIELEQGIKHCRRLLKDGSLHGQELLDVVHDASHHIDTSHVNYRYWIDRALQSGVKSLVTGEKPQAEAIPAPAAKTEPVTLRPVEDKPAGFASSSI